jgi:oligosaccharide amylase
LELLWNKPQRTRGTQGCEWKVIKKQIRFSTTRRKEKSLVIKQPNSIIGNQQLLVTLGMKGEIFGMYYPGRDYAQQVTEALFGVHTNGSIHWLNSIDWQSKQYYPNDSGILKTELKHSSGIGVSITDVVPPDYPVLIRHLKINNNELEGTFYTYFDFNMGERKEKNSGFYDEAEGMLSQYWQNHYVGITTTPAFNDWQVGKALGAAWWTSARWGVERGELQKNKEDIGNVNIAAGFPLTTKEITQYVIFAKNREELYDLKEQIKSIPFASFITKTHEEWENWLLRGKEIDVPGRLNSYYYRSLQVLRLLCDEKLGSVVAAPEFDHEYEECGGYGFCWNRDAVEVIRSLHNAGYTGYLPRFIRWCKHTQLKDGSWFQRYWLNGSLAPSWGNFDYSTQIDETASTVYTMAKYGQSLPEGERQQYLDCYWQTINHGSNYLMKRTREGLHDPCTDLWETYHGSFTYTSAAIYAALTEVAKLAQTQSKSASIEYEARAKRIKQKTIKMLWMPETECFAKAIINNEIYPVIDASVIGTFTPFNMLDITNSDERKKIIQMLNTIEKRLNCMVNGKKGIKRYENDKYRGGNPWTVTTLWLIKAQLRMAEYYMEKDEKMREQWLNNTRPYFDMVINSTTNTKLLPEQINKHTGNPAWAIPLAWSSALFIEAVQKLSKILHNHRI